MDGAVRFTAPFGLTVTGGLGTALVNGYGAPALRVFVLAGWHAPLRPKIAEAPPPPPEVDAGLPFVHDRWLSGRTPPP